ncbi:MAG: translation initiation factor Sui1 [Parahaliea sp.]
MAQQSRRVYSTDNGKYCPQCTRSLVNCICRQSDQNVASGDGIVRIHRETKGRGGKAVTVIRGLPLAESELKTLAKALKQRCGVGGSVKDRQIEIQGDQRDTLKTELEKRGYTVRLSGG